MPTWVYLFSASEGVTPSQIADDDDMVDLIASLKYVRVNYIHFSSPEMCLYEALSLVLKNLLCLYIFLFVSCNNS